MTQVTQPRRGVFISYSRADGEQVAHELHARLTAELPDVPAWLDRYEIEGGVGWWNQIEEQLDRAEFLIIIMTPVAMHSENTRREWRGARQRGVCVYPVKGAPDVLLEFEALPNWMRKAHFYDPSVEWLKLISHLRRGCQATRVPFMAPELPAGYVARERELAALRDLLLIDGMSPRPCTAALRGAGGFGKTTLAAAICHDPQCIDAFDDGILWVTLGQDPNMLNELVKLYAALTGERPGFVDVEDAAREVRRKLEQKNCLIVVDDAWRAADVRRLLVGGPGCTRLITTRSLEIAIEATRVEVNRMTPSEALQMFLMQANIAPDDTAPFAALVGGLRLWALPIRLAAATMRQRMERGQSLESALEHLTRVLAKRGITGFDGDQPLLREDAVSRTVAASLQLLSAKEQQCCFDLTVLQVSQPIPISAATALWQLDELDSEKLASTMDNLSLIVFDLGSGTLSLHDELRDYLARRVDAPEAVHARLLSTWGNPNALPDTYAWRAYAYHLTAARRPEQLRALLLDFDWLRAKLEATDIHALLQDFDYAVEDPKLTIVAQALRLSAPILAVDKAQLSSQLTARLRPEVLLALGHHRNSSGCWLRLLHDTLDAAGGMLILNLTGHHGGVTSLATKADRTIIVSGSNGGTVRVWDGRNGRTLHVMRDPLHGLAIRTVAVTADGSLALSGGANGRICWWDLVSGTLLHSALLGNSAIKAIAMSADGAIAVCAPARQPQIWLCDVQRRSIRSTLNGHSDTVLSVAISADGAWALSGSEDCTARVWNLKTHEQRHMLEGHRGAVRAVSLSADGRYALTGSEDRTIRLWDLESGSCLRSIIAHERFVTSVDLSADAQRAISAGNDRVVSIWDLSSGMLLNQLSGHSEPVSAVSFDRTAAHATTASQDATLKIWRLEGARRLTAATHHTERVTALVFSADGRQCASGGADGRVCVLDVTSGAVVQSFEAHAGPVQSLAFTADGECLLSGGVDRQYWFLIVESGERVWIPLNSSAPESVTSMSPIARFLAVCCTDGFVYLWDVPSGSLVQRYSTRVLFDSVIQPAPQRQSESANDVLADTYLPGEDVYNVIAASVSTDGVQALFSGAGARIGYRRREHSVAVAADRAPPSSAIVVLNLETQEVNTLAVAQSAPISALAGDAQRRRVLWARADHTLELWEIKSAQRVAFLRGHTETVAAVAFSPDGRFGYSCGRDRTVRAWELRDGSQAAGFTADAALCALAVSGADGTIAAGDQSGSVHLLRVESQ